MIIILKKNDDDEDDKIDDDDDDIGDKDNDNNDDNEDFKPNTLTITQLILDKTDADINDNELDCSSEALRCRNLFDNDEKYF